MKRARLLVAALGIGLCYVAPSEAALYAYNAYAVLGSGSGNTFYDIDQATANPDFVGQTFTINFGQSLKIGGEVTSDAGGSQPAANGPEWGKILWKIDNGAEQSLDLANIGDFGTAGWKVQFQQASYASMTEIGNSLTYGNHSLQVWFQTHDNNQPADAWVNAGGANYSASIQVVPEPVALSLVLFATIGLAGAAFKTLRFRLARS